MRSGLGLLIGDDPYGGAKRQAYHHHTRPEDACHLIQQPAVSELPRAAVAEEDAGTHAGKLLELPREMRLIGVATRQRHLRPVRSWLVPRAQQDPAKAADARELLGGHPHLVAEDVNEVPMAQRQLVGCPLTGDGDAVVAACCNMAGR